MTTTLQLELLGVPVDIRCDDPALREKLALCYACSSRADASDAALSAGITGGGGSWRIRVEGRDDHVATDAIVAVRTFNHELLHGLMLRAPSLYYVHASVLDVNGQGLVLPGLSQAGKSTLALALVLEGARFVSDELLAYDPETGMARAFPRAIKIRDVCADYFPELAGDFRGEGEGRFVPFPALRDDVVIAETPVRAFVAPRWNATGDGEPIAITRGQALLELAASSLNFGTHRERSVDWLAAIAGEVQAFRLTWREPRATARRLLEVLDT